MATANEPSTIKIPNLKELKDVKDSITVWYDNTANQSEDLISFQELLHSVIRHIEVFDNFTLCRDYISSKIEEKVFLIISGTDSNQLVYDVHDSAAINFIYVFSSEKHLQEELKRTYTKVRGVYENKHELVKMLKRDIQRSLFDMLPMRALDYRAIQKSIKELNQEGGLFIWSHFLIYILCNMEHKEDAKNDMLHFARQCYKDDKRALIDINQFELNYTAENVLEWYTKDSFFYRLLNRALRSENFEAIYKFRSFIADLHQKLKNIHNDDPNDIFSLCCDDTFKVYRGQLLPKREFEILKENINGFVTMNAFLSTSLIEDSALMFSGNGEHRPVLESVLFEITVNENDLTEPYARLSEFSDIQDECEVLFSIGCVFRIDSVQTSSNTRSRIGLSLVRHDDANVRAFSQYLRDSVGSKPTFIDLLDIFYNMNDYQRVAYYSKTLLETLSLTDGERSMIYSVLGQAELHVNGDLAKAEAYISKIKEIAERTPTVNYDALTVYYECMGLIYIEKQNFTYAIELFNKTLEINKISSVESSIVAGTYGNLGLVYRKLFQLDEACAHYEKALDIFTKSGMIPKLHSNYFTVLSNLAFTKQLQFNFDEALKYYNLALEYEQKSLPAIHSITATTLGNIGLLHSMKYDHEKALKTYKKAFDMFNQIYGDDHPRLGIMYSNIGDLFMKVGEYDQAEKNLYKALNIESRDKFVDVDCLGATLTSLGFIHLRLNSFDESFGYLSQALDIRLKIPEGNPNNICDTYMVLARYYLAKSDYCQALKYCEMSGKRYGLGPDKSASIHECFGDIFYEKRDLDEAISHYHSSIDILLKFETQFKPFLARLYYNVTKVYADKQQWHEALQTLEAGLKLAPENSITMALLYQLNGYVLTMLNGSFDSVEKYLDLAKTLFVTLAPGKNIYIGNNLRILGDLNYRKGKFDIARQNLMEALEIFEENLPKSHLKVSETYIKIGRLYQKQNKMDEAAEIFEKVKVILKERFDNTVEKLELTECSRTIDCKMLCTIYDILANIHANKKHFNQAHEAIQHGLALRQQFRQNDLPLSHFNLAKLYAQENNSEKAVDLLNRITHDELLRVQDCAPTLLSNEIAVLYSQLAQYQSALKMLKFTLNNLDENDQHFRISVNVSMGSIYQGSGNAVEAIKHYNQALKMIKKANSKKYERETIHIYESLMEIDKTTNSDHQMDNSYQTLFSINSAEELIRVYMMIGFYRKNNSKIKESFKMYQLALAICPPDNYELLGDIHEKLGELYSVNNDTTASIANYEISRDKRLLFMQQNDSRLNPLFISLGLEYLKAKQFYAASDLLERVLTNHINNSDQRDNIIKTLILLAKSNYDQENFAQSITYNEKAFDLSMQMSSLDYWRIMCICSNLAEANFSVANWRLCVEWYEIALQVALTVDPPNQAMVEMCRESLHTASNVIDELGRENSRPQVLFVTQHI